MSNLKVWFVAEGGQTVGPMSKAELLEGIRSGRYNQQTLVFTQGMSDWTPAAQVVGLQLSSGSPSAASAMHDVDYQIFGEEMQFVEVELDPGESAVAEAGGMM